MRSGRTASHAPPWYESLLVVRPGDRELPSRLHPRIGRLRVRLAAVTFDRATERDLPKLSPDLGSHRLELAAADPWGGGDAPWVLAFLTPREAPIGAHWSSDHCGIRSEVELLRAERTGDQYVEAILQVRALREATD